MPKPKWPAALGAAILLAVLLAGLLYFAGLGSPGAYPDMSSLNAGPPGAKLLFDTLANLRPLQVERNYLPLDQWRPARTTILLFAVKPETLAIADKEFFVQLERLSGPGNRLLLFLTGDELETKPDPKNPPAFKTRWGAQFSKAGTLALDASWRRLADGWEKRFPNGGTVVLALHSENFSNAQLAADSTRLGSLPPLLGPNKSIAFEETHLGIEDTGSIAALARRYRLEGLIAGLLFLAALFIWHQSVSFPPPPPAARGREAPVIGAAGGGLFANLIARHLSAPALIEACVAEWNRVQPRRRLSSEPPGERQSKLDAVALYRKLQESLLK